MNRLRTPAEAKLWLRNHGVSIQAFAHAQDLDAATWHQVLDGRKKGLRGEAHDAAVALGVKPDLSGDDVVHGASASELNSANPSALIFLPYTTNGLSAFNLRPAEIILPQSYFWAHSTFAMPCCSA